MGPLGVFGKHGLFDQGIIYEYKMKMRYGCIKKSYHYQPHNQIIIDADQTKAWLS